MLQRIAACFVCNKYQRNISVTNLLCSFSWPSLETRRSYLKLNLTYKILDYLITIPPDNFRPVNYHTRGHQQHLQHLQCNCDSYRYSLSPSSIRLWNSLPLNIATCNDFEKIDQSLKNYFCINQFCIYVILSIEVCILNNYYNILKIRPGFYKHYAVRSLCQISIHDQCFCKAKITEIIEPVQESVSLMNFYTSY